MNLHYSSPQTLTVTTAKPAKNTVFSHLFSLIRKKVEENGILYTKEALIEKLTSIHYGWIIHDQKKVDRVVEQLDKEQKKLLDIALALTTS